MQFNSWMPKEDWSKQICEMHRIESKQYIANLLHETFVHIGKELDKAEFGEYIKAQVLRAQIAIQILSVSFEMTEDLAATCFSYAKALKNNNKNIPEYLRDFGDPDKKKEEVGSPNIFYDKASKDICYAAEMVGLDPLKDVTESINVFGFFKRVRDWRREFDDWYQGYKHGQRTLPIYVWPTDSNPTKENVEILIYRIPQLIQENSGQIFVESDFKAIIKEEQTLMNLVTDVIRVWAMVKQRQFGRVFPETPAPIK